MRSTDRTDPGLSLCLDIGRPTPQSGTRTRILRQGKAVHNVADSARLGKALPRRAAHAEPTNLHLAVHSILAARADEVAPQQNRQVSRETCLMSLRLC